MKKLFTYLMLWLAATSNNLDFSYAGDVPFQSTDNYYNGSNHDTYIDYKEKYSSYIGDEAKADDGCNLRRRIPEGGLSSQAKGLLGAYWIVYGGTLPDASDTAFTNTQDYMLNCTSGTILIAPVSCTIITRAKASNYGTYMQLELGKGDFVMTITDMERWYCCLDRPDNQKLENGFFQHTEDAYGVQLEAGNIIGLAGPNTRISIQDCRDTVHKATSVYKYYNGGY